MLRLFVALWPPDGVAESLAECAAFSLRTREGRELRQTAPHRIHLTCAFLGDVPGTRVGELADRLTALAAEVHAFELTLDHAGHFGDRVVWAAPREPVEDLRALAKSTRIAIREAGLSVQGNDFRPHVTLARTRQEAVLAPVAAALSEALAANPITWHADDLCLVSSVRSPAASYGILERWPLS